MSLICNLLYELQRCIECNDNELDNCTTIGEDGPGVADADFIVYVTVLDEAPCGPDSSTLAFAGACEMEQVLDR